MENPDLLTASYDYDFDESLIAARPASPRDHSRLLVYHEETGTIEHRIFKELPELLKSGDQIVFNQSKVYPCRLFAKKSSGGKAELFLLALESQNSLYPVMIKSNGKKHLGDKYNLGEFEFEIVSKGEEGVFWGRFNIDESKLLDILETQGQVPIPPYIREGKADEKDKSDYQTIYAKESGSVAAPTAGLHFTPQVFSDLEQKGIEKAFVTLHVGMGTFRPVQSENILEHQMHSEIYQVDQENLAKIKSAKRRIAVGTTSLRVLESIYANGEFSQAAGETNIFLYPGVEVKSISGLLTNFHLPKSTLLMLVSSLIGREKTLELYKIAVESKYRFYSYGDAMLILRKS